jgi:1-acyl-sn-glycerol-3-phosphate acyltransferase
VTGTPGAATPAVKGLRSKQPSSSLAALCFYEFVAGVIRLLTRLFYRAEAIDPHHVPQSGPVLLAANHQSFLDPPLIGIRVRHRHLNFIARAGLFKFKPFGAIIGALNALPINDEGGDLGAIKETLTRLQQGRAILIFPEGSRCNDGAVDAFKRGVALLVKKAKCPVVPVAIEGAFDAWPNSRALPRLFGCRVYVKFGPPIAYDDLMAHGAEAALETLRVRIDAMRRELRHRMRTETGGSFPARSKGDEPLKHATEPQGPVAS